MSLRLVSRSSPVCKEEKLEGNYGLRHLDLLAFVLVILLLLVALLKGKGLKDTGRRESGGTGGGGPAARKIKIKD